MSFQWVSWPTESQNVQDLIRMGQVSSRLTGLLDRVQGEVAVHLAERVSYLDFCASLSLMYRIIFPVETSTPRA